VLQKIKKVCIILLSLTLLLGGAYLAVNYISKFFIAKALKNLTGTRAKLYGYRLNPTGSLVCDSIVSEGKLYFKNLQVKFKPLHLLTLKTLDRVYIEELKLRLKIPEKIEHAGTGMGGIRISFGFDEIKIVHSEISFDSSNSVTVEGFYAQGTPGLSSYEVKVYADKITWNNFQVHFYTDIVLYKDKIQIKALEVQNEKLQLSGLSGTLALKGSWEIKAEYAKFENSDIRGSVVTYSPKENRGNISFDVLNIQNHKVKKGEGTFALFLPDSILFPYLTIAYGKNTLKASVKLDIKNKKLLVRDSRFTLEKLKGVINGEIYLVQNGIEGTFEGKDIRFQHSHPFSLELNFALRRDNIRFDLYKVKSLGTELKAEIIYAKDHWEALLTGYAAPGDIYPEASGTINIEGRYTIFSQRREGGLKISGNSVSAFDISADTFYFMLSSKGSEDNIQIFIPRGKYKELTITDLSLNLNSHSLSEFESNLKGSFNEIPFHLDLHLARNQNEWLLSFKSAEVITPVDTLRIESPVFLKITNEGLLEMTDEATVLFGNGFARLKGYIDLKEQRQAINLKFLNIPVKNIKGFSGIFSGSAEIDGSWKEPVITFNLSGNNLNYNQIQNSSLSSEIRIYPDGFYIDSLVVEGLDLKVAGSGFYPITFSLHPFRFEPVKNASYLLQIQVEKIPLNILAKLTQGQLILNSGNFSGNVKIIGKIGETPKLSGYVQGSNLNGIYTPIQLEFNNGRLNCELSDEGFVIQEALFYKGKGRLKAEGFGKNLFSQDRIIDISLSANDISLYPTDYIIATADGKVSIQYINQFLNIKGDILAKDGTIFLSLTPSPSPQKSLPPSNLNLLLNITSEGNTFIVNELSEIEFKGKITFQLSEGKPILGGAAEILKGYFLYLDRIFDVEQGYINFTTSNPMEPNITLNASTKVDTFKVLLNVSGTIQNPAIKLASEPPLDELNIIYLLTTGRLYGDTTGAGTEAEELKARAMTLASTVLSQSMRRLLKLREFKIESAEGEPTSYVTFGLFVTPKLYLRYSHDVFDITKDLFTVKYELNKNLGLFAERGDDQKLKIGAEYLYEF